MRSPLSPTRTWSLNALSGIGGVQTNTLRPTRMAVWMSLNALSGIGGVQTEWGLSDEEVAMQYVLMPCRALEAFRLKLSREELKALKKS